MKFTPSSAARRRTAIASVRLLGGPQTPSPVRRIAPKPRRCTETSPPSETLPAKVADVCFAFITFLLLSHGVVQLDEYASSQWDATTVPGNTPSGLLR